MAALLKMSIMNPVETAGMDLHTKQIESSQIDWMKTNFMVSPCVFIVGRSGGFSLSAVAQLHTCMSHISLFLCGCSAAEKWYKRHLTYQIVNWPRHLSLGSVRLAVHAAFQLWSNVSGLVFQEAPEGPADIRLAFYEGDHNDGAGNAFDGPGQGHPHTYSSHHR